mmetsp:Transcript_49619/g.91578  ORF Transcript_49619/g.91578 Transcript_49619/m.91578 type:complete len:353 (-) Transcript_49619:9-1067(-)
MKLRLLTVLLVRSHLLLAAVPTSDSGVQALLSACQLPHTDIAPRSCPELAEYVVNASRLDVEMEAAASENYVGAGMLLLELARRDDCLAELEKEQTEIRCAQVMYKAAIQRFWMGGREDLADLVWREATREVNGTQRILWPSFEQTPTYWLPSHEVKDYVVSCEAYPQLDLDVLWEEMVGLALDKPFGYLKAYGTWEGMFLYRRNQWNESTCDLMPRTCASLKSWFPVASSNELIRRYQEAVVFRTQPDTKVQPHVGALNGIVNVHWTLHGGGSTVMRVGKTDLQLQDGRSICFLDSVMHELRHTGEGYRWSFVVRAPHPDLPELGDIGCSNSDLSPNGAEADSGLCRNVQQ